MRALLLPEMSLRSVVFIGSGVSSPQITDKSVGWFLRALEEKPKKRPHCCRRDLPVNLVAHQSGHAFLEKYRMFELEIATPNPLYCSSRKCNTFVPPSNIHGDIGVCGCGGRTCRHCCRQEHPGKLCAQDQDTQKVEALGKSKGWKHCPRCKHMIERTAGCLHMTCSQCRTVSLRFALMTCHLQLMSTRS